MRTIRRLDSSLTANIDCREEDGDPVTLMFELDGCGLKNMDMEFIQYLIGVFRDYSPFSLNYILVYEMPWVLNGKC